MTTIASCTCSCAVNALLLMVAVLLPCSIHLGEPFTCIASAHDYAYVSLYHALPSHSSPHWLFSHVRTIKNDFKDVETRLLPLVKERMSQSGGQEDEKLTTNLVEECIEHLVLQEGRQCASRLLWMLTFLE